MNTFGNIFKVTLYGESHGPFVGVLIDGFPCGIKIELDDLRKELNKRRPGVIGTTKRVETDEPIIVSGVFNGYSNGGIINVMFENANIKSGDYSQFQEVYRPGTSDFVANRKYQGFNDYRGSGFFSGRVTIGLVCAGYFAKLIANYKYSNEIVKLGTLNDLSRINDYVEEVVAKKDSVGGVIKITVKKIPVGLGEPFFGKVESMIGSILFSVPSVKGVSFGIGFDGAELFGSQFNDVFINDKGQTLTNNNGGVNAGVTNGNDLVVNVLVKPTPSIAKVQETFNFKTKKMEKLEITGRHDSAIIRRIGIILESCISICLADLVLLAKVSSK